MPSFVHRTYQKEEFIRSKLLFLQVNGNFVSCFVRAWKIVSHVQGTVQSEDVWRQDTDEVLGSKTENAAGNQRKTKDKIIPLHAMKGT